ncbi:MAG: gamma carbonic anhydrase family protein [Proteobacteria bacterium]|nr:gamma carbonic anhydrase family protein [Pseudomonadota bacterium]
MGAPVASATGGLIYALGDLVPRIAPDAFIAPNAVIIGDVEIGSGSSVWFGCVLRGDTNFIRVGARCNIQDGTIVHVNSGEFPTIIEDDVTIGHAAIIHACTLRRRAFVGMGATVLDGSVIEEGGMIGANGLLSPGKVIGRNEMWMGAPAALRRVMPDAERAGWDRTAVHYAELAQRYRSGVLRQVPRGAS